MPAQDSEVHAVSQEQVHSTQVAKMAPLCIDCDRVLVASICLTAALLLWFAGPCSLHISLLRVTAPRACFGQASAVTPFAAAIASIVMKCQIYAQHKTLGFDFHKSPICKTNGVCNLHFIDQKEEVQ